MIWVDTEPSKAAAIGPFFRAPTTTRSAPKRCASSMIASPGGASATVFSTISPLATRSAAICSWAESMDRRSSR